MVLMLGVQSLTLIVAATELEPYYFVNKDSPSMGGCTPTEVQWLQDAYREAIDMVRDAESEIRFVLNGKVSLRTKPDQHRWDKAATMLINLFDIHVHPQKARGVQDKNQAARLNGVNGERIKPLHKVAQ